jgi:hypothetical protein
MRKKVNILLITLLLGFVYTQDEQTNCGQEVCLSIGNVNSENGTMDVLYESLVPILGYQFDINAITLIEGYGGASEAAGLQISISSNSILAWGMNNIEPGNGTLLQLSFESGPETEACLIAPANYEQFLITTSFSGDIATSNSNVCINIANGPQDCMGDWGGNAEYDECGVCDGDNSICSDCANVPNGSNSVDECGTCDDDSSNDCVQDCLGDWGGNATLDECGVCDGDNSICSDCANVPNGSNSIDECGICDDNPSNDCIQDCAGNWGGTAYVDQCETCDDNLTNDCLMDCTDQWGGSANVDQCGTCDDNPSNDCVQDCANEWGGSANVDQCGTCDDNPSNDCVQDCANEWGGNAVEDNCSNCDNDSSNDCVQDCADEWGGFLVYDGCGVCGGDSDSTDFDNDNTPDVCDDTPYGDVELNYNSININESSVFLSFISNTLVYGIQFSLDNIIINNITAGNEVPEEFTVGYNENGQILIFSPEGLAIIPANTEISLEIQYSNIEGPQTCINQMDLISFVTTVSGEEADVTIANNCIDVVQDCAGLWGGNNEVLDDCCSDNSYCVGPEGDFLAGTTCSEINYNLSNDVLDVCGVCGGDNISSNGLIVGSNSDCAGVCYGNSYEDDCGNCDNIVENDCNIFSAYAGEDQYVYIPHDGNPETNTIEVILDGSGSPGIIEGCSWSTGSRDNLDECIATVILAPGEYTYTLTVIDPNGEQDTDQMTIYVQPEQNQDPTASIYNTDLVFPADHSGNPLNDVATVTLDGSSSSDTEDDDITYTWQQISGNYIDIGENNNSILSFDAPVGDYGIRLTVTDIYGATHSDEVSVTVTLASNESPVVNAGEDIPVFVNSDCNSETNSVMVNLPGNNSEISDSDNDELSYIWSLDNEEICSTLECSVELNASETPNSILLTVTDSYGESNSDEILVTVNSENEGNSPIATAPANQNIQVSHDGDINTHDATITLTGSGFDNDSEYLTSFWLNSSGDTLGFGTILEATLVGPEFGGSDIIHILTFGVSDCYNTDTQNVSVTIQSESNFSPVINLPVSASYPLLYGESTKFVTIDGCNQVSDGDTTDILLYEWTLNNVNMPETTCEFSFNANNGDNVGLTVTDPYGGTDSDIITIELIPADNQTPIVILPELIDNFTISHDGDPTTGIDTVSYTPGSELVFDPEDDDLNFVWSQISGNLVSFNPTNAELSFVANAGDYCFTLNVTDPFDLSANDDVCITINPEENEIPFATDMPDTVVTIAHDGVLDTHTETVTICADGSDADGDNYSYMWDNGKTTDCISETITELTGTCFTFSVLDTYNEPEDGWNLDEICVSLYEPNTIPNIVVQNNFEFPIPHDGSFGGSASLTIDASSSNDDEGDELSYQWAIVNELNTSISELIVGENANTISISDLAVGDYTYRLFITDVYGNFSDESTYNVIDIFITILSEENSLSVANAGQDLDFQPIHDGNPGDEIEINLNGASTQNSDGDILNYTWDLVSIQTGDDEAIDLRTNVGLTESVNYLYSYSGLETQILTFELNAQDDYMVNSDVNSVDQMIVTITPEENNTPEAETISFIQDVIPHDGNANSGTATIVIDGVNSNDLDVEDVLSFNWADQDGNAFGAGSQMSAALVAGTYQFTLTVSDPYGANNTSQTTIIVLPEPNNLPEVNAGEDQVIEIEHDGNPNTPALFNFNICGTALDNDAMDVHTYQWNDSGFNDNNCADVEILNIDEATCHTFTVSDGYSEVSDEVCLSLNEPNDAPIVNSGVDFEQILLHDGFPGGLVNVSINIDDEDVDSHTCQWFEGELEVQGNCTNVDLSIGNHDLRVVVLDSYGATGSDEITISVSEENATPNASAGDDQVVILDHDGIPNSGEIEVTLNASGSTDEDFDALSYTWYPGDLTQTDRNSMTGTGESFTTSLGEGEHYFSVIVADNYGADDTASVMITVNPEENSNPTVSVEVFGNPQAGHSGNSNTDFGEFSISAVGIDSDNLDGEPNYSWELTSGEGITNLVGENTSEISGNALTGEYIFAITVTDVYGGSNTEIITLTMAEAPNQAPTLIDISDINQPIDHDGDPTTMMVSIPLSAEGSSDPDGDLLSYYWVNLTDTIATGVNPTVEFEGALDLKCTEVIVYAHDSYTNNGIASKSFNVCIEPEPNTAPEITAELEQPFQVEHDGNPNTTLIQVELSSSVSDDPNDELTLSWSQDIGDELQVELMGADTQTPQFELFLSEAIELHFTLSAEDSYGLTTTQNVMVNLNPESNNSPVLVMNHDAPIEIPHDGSGETNLVNVSFNLSIEDEIEDSHEIIWQDTNGNLIAQNSNEINLELPDGSHSITVIVTDSYGSSVTHVEVISIEEENNNLPQVSAGADILLPLNNSCGGENLGSTDLPLTIDDFDEVDTHSCSWVDTDTNEELCDSCYDCNLDELEIGIYYLSVSVDDGYGILVTDDLQIIVEETFSNDNPYADAGVDAGYTLDSDGIPGGCIDVVVDGCNSEDPDGCLLTYSWTNNGIELLETENCYDIITLCNEDNEVTEHNLSLIVSDPDGGVSDSDDLIITLSPEDNSEPICSVSEDQSVTIDHDGNPDCNSTTVTFTGSCSDPEDNSLIISWTQSSGPALDLNTTQGENFEIDLCPSVLDQAQVYCFQINGTDEFGLIGSKESCVTVNPEPNNNPTVDFSSDLLHFEIVHDGDPLTNSLEVNLSAIINDVDNTGDFNEIATINWTDNDGNSICDSENCSPVVTTEGACFTVTATDNYGATGSNEICVAIAEPNIAPTTIIEELSQSDLEIAHNGIPNEGSISITLDADSSTDADGDEDHGLTYLWTTGESSPIITINGLTEGDYSYSVTVSDPYGASTTETINVTIVEPNEAPIADAGEDMVFTLPHNCTLSDDLQSIVFDAINSIDNDGDFFTIYNWIDLSDGSSVCDDIDCSLTHSLGNYSYELTVADVYGATGKDTVNYRVEIPNDNPVCNLESETFVINEDEAYTINGCGSTDPEECSIEFSWTGDAISNDCLNSYFAPNLATNNPLTLYYNFEVIDQYGATCEIDQEVIVLNVNVAPELEFACYYGQELIVDGQSYDIPHDGNPNTSVYSISCNSSGSSDFDGDDLTFNWTSIDETDNGSTTSFNLTEGLKEITITVNDGNGGEVTQSISVDINAEPNEAPEIEFDSVLDIVDENGWHEFSDCDFAADPENDPMSWVWTKGTDDCPSYQYISNSTSCNNARILIPSLTTNTYCTIPLNLEVSDPYDKSDSEGKTIIVVNINEEPTEVANRDSHSDTLQVVYNCDPTIFEATTEICAVYDDADSDDLEFVWQCDNGLNGFNHSDSIAYHSGGMESCISVSFNGAGPHECLLEVTDILPEGEYFDDPITVSKSYEIILIPNLGVEPIAELNEPPFTIIENNSFDFSGTNSTDPENCTLTYEWKLDDVLISDSIIYVFEAENLVTNLSAYHNIELSITDPHGNIDSIIHTIEVRNFNIFPTGQIEPIEDIVLPHDCEIADTLLNFIALFSDEDNDDLTYEWTLDGNLILMEEQDSHIVLQLDVGIHNIEVEVFDGLASTISIIEVGIFIDNNAPVIYIEQYGNFPVGVTPGCEFEPVNLLADCSDIDGDELECIWYNSNNEQIASSCNTITDISCELESEIYTLQCTDCYGESTIDSLEVHLFPLNVAPTCASDLLSSLSVTIEQEIDFSTILFSEISDTTLCYDPNEREGDIEDYINSCQFIQDISSDGCISYLIPMENESDSGWYDCELDQIILPDYSELDADMLENDFCFDINLTDSFDLSLQDEVRFHFETCNSDDIPLLTDGNLIDGNNLVSFTCFPYNTSMEQFFNDNPFINFIISQGLGIFKMDDGSLSGNLTKFDYHKGYWINTNECDGESCEHILNLNGVKVTDNVIYDLKGGNNLIGIHGFSENTNEIFETFGGEEFASLHFDYIIGQGLGLFFTDVDQDGDNEWSGNLSQLEPFHGYWLQNDSVRTMQFTFPEHDESISREIISQTEIRDEFKPNQSMEQSFYLAKEIIVEGELAQYGDILLSFNDNVLTGSAVIEDGPTTIAVMGRDMTDETIGFHEVGQTPQFKVYLQNSGEIVELTSSNNTGWTPMSMHQMDRLMGEVPKVVVNEFSFNTPYPNPFNPVTTFNYGLPNEGKVTITVYNLNGEKVTELLNDTQSSGIFNMDWDAGEMAAGVYFINLEVNEIGGESYQQTQKVILLK